MPNWIRFASCAGFAVSAVCLAWGGSDFGSEERRRVFVRGGENLIEVRNTVRRIRKENPKCGVDIVLRSGEYCLPDGIDFTEDDCGASTENLVVWRSEFPGGAMLFGGATVPPSQFRVLDNPDLVGCLRPEARGKVLVADVSSILPRGAMPLPSGFTTPAPPSIFIDGELGTLARWPNEGFAVFTEVISNGNRLASDSILYSDGAFVFNDKRILYWDFADGVYLNGYWTHDWSNYSVKAKSWGSENGINGVFRLAAAVPYGVKNKSSGLPFRRFFAFNLFSELDFPGEWWLDRNRKLLYVYPRSERLTEVRVSMSRQPLVRGRGIRNMRFDGLVFGCNHAGLVDFSEAENVIFEGCRLRGTAENGADVSGRRCQMSGCEITNCGGCGISIGGGDRRTLARSDNLIENCRIHDFGVFRKTYAPGIEVRWDSVGVTVRGNEIFDAPHSAVIYGGNEHLFESNDVHHVLLETGDAGAYYTGRDWTTQGNVLRRNVTHDLGRGGHTPDAMGFYFDDCDCGDEAYGNSFINIVQGIKVGGGRDHPIVGNVFSNCVVGISMDCRGMKWKQWNSLEHGGRTWMFEEKAKRLGYTNGVWAVRYPRLANIMNDHPREPLHNPVVSNVFMDCTGDLFLLDKDATPILERLASITNNLVIYTSVTNRRAKIDNRIGGGFWLCGMQLRNPVLEGWYADPQIRCFNGIYWIFPTSSRVYDEQTFIDAFSSADFKTWKKHSKVLKADDILWARRCLWAPDVHKKDGRFYMFFSANDPYPVDGSRTGIVVRTASDMKYGGIGVAVAEQPEGPYRDLIGKPLIDRFWNGAQPIDQYVFEHKGEWYMLYGGWGRCNLVRLSSDFRTLLPFKDGSLCRNVTPKDYVEGPVMFERYGIWYFMYSSGNWTQDDYRVNYCIGTTPFGPFEFKGSVLSSQKSVATGAGHHSVICIPGTDEWYICYHRRPIPSKSPHHRVVCINRMHFDNNGDIQPIVMEDDDKDLSR